MMKRVTPAVLVLSLVPAVCSPAAAASVSGPAALALAGVIAPASPLLSSGEQKAVAMMFAETSSIPYRKKIPVTADRIVCRTSNVDITLRSCELTFGKKTRTINGRAANELFATEAMAGVPSAVAAGTVYESLSKLNCTLDPQAIKERGGAGAECSYEAEK